MKDPDKGFGFPFVWYVSPPSQVSFLLLPTLGTPDLVPKHHLASCEECKVIIDPSARTSRVFMCLGLTLRNVPVTPTPSIFQKYCRTNGGRTAVQMGGVLQYKWEAYCRVSLSSKLRSQENTAIQMGGVLPYKLEVYCRTFSETSCRGWGFRNIAHTQAS